MFTVPSVAENLIEEYNAFAVMTEFFLEQLEEQVIIGGEFFYLFEKHSRLLPRQWRV
jgi:hypothetical protein